MVLLRFWEGFIKVALPTIVSISSLSQSKTWQNLVSLPRRVRGKQIAAIAGIDDYYYVFYKGSSVGDSLARMFGPQELPDAITTLY